MFVNERGQAALARGLRLSFQELGLQIGAPRMALPHSAGVTGARWWFRFGESITFIEAIGDWADEKTPKPYLGGLVMIHKLKRELIGPATPALDMSSVIQRTVEAHGF